MPQDPFSTTDSVTSPSREWFDIAPSDNVDLSVIPKAIYVGTGGDLVVSSARTHSEVCLLYTSPSPRDKRQSRMPSSA